MQRLRQKVETPNLEEDAFRQNTFAMETSHSFAEDQALLSSNFSK